jgi:hypothetical protein
MTLADGKLMLLGIAWAVSTIDVDPDPNTTVDRPASAFSYIGSHTAEILPLIPETGVAFMALLAGVILTVRRRRGGD